MNMYGYNVEFFQNGQSICKLTVALGDMRKSGSCGVVDLIRKAEEQFKRRLPTETLDWSTAKFQSPDPVDDRKEQIIQKKDMPKLIASANKEIDENYQRNLEFSKQYAFMDPPKRPIHLKYP